MLEFEADRTRTQVSMATDSPHRIIMEENVVPTLVTSFLLGSYLFSKVTRTTISRMIIGKMLWQY